MKLSIAIILCLLFIIAELLCGFHHLVNDLRSQIVQISLDKEKLNQKCEKLAIENMLRKYEIDTIAGMLR